MSTTGTTDPYVMGRTPEEYERLRQQSRVWQDATATLIDRAPVAPGARCLDAGCGPGETMRLLAERVGPTGTVIGLDVDGDLVRVAIEALRAQGHEQCAFVEADVETTDAVGDGGFDVVLGRLILLHVNDPVSVLRRLWRWTAPGGRLIIQDYDLRGVEVYPELPVVAEWRRVFLGTFTAVGRDIRLGHRSHTSSPRPGSGLRTAPRSPAGWSGSRAPAPCSPRRIAASHPSRSPGASSPKGSVTPGSPTWPRP